MAEPQELQELLDAMEPFVRVVRINAPLSADWPDDYPPKRFMPGIWPNWAEFKRAEAAFVKAGGRLR